MNTAICFFLASPRHRIPSKPRWRWFYRHARAAGLRVLRQNRRVPRPGGYEEGLRHAVASLRLRSANVPRIILLTPDDVVAPEGIDEIIRVDPAPYCAVRGAHYEFGVTVFMKLAVFSLSRFDRVIYFDSDVLFVDDVSDLWAPDKHADRALYGVRESERIGTTAAQAMGKVNTGVMVLNARSLDGAAHLELFALARAGNSYDGGDQGIINAFVAARRPEFAGELDPSLNVFVNDRSIDRRLMDALPARVLHFTGLYKPFATTHGDEFVHDEEIRALYWSVANSQEPRPLARGIEALVSTSPRR